MLLNYVTAPDVLIWSASAASCGIPLVYGSSKLLCKDAKGEIAPWITDRGYLDGSIDSDLPLAPLSRFFNLSCTLVSQVNPHVIFFHQKKRKIIGFWLKR